ncbi:MAG: mannose-1-phosphate guanylyltransferase/mannose-6-phosphate isomerase [Thermodesulfobacteriota bacterium]|nr:mannose-1-phosphate guanylyltransferase/mannose-6-phosphate isomerase [Thermodesulfobacteriota bacterium]
MLISIVLSGGVGARLWPVSRETYPKPFIKLADGRSLIQKTFERVANFEAVNEILTVTNRDHFFQTLDEFASLPMSKTTKLEFLLEPTGRNTAPAIAMAALYVSEHFGSETVMLVLPADHVIEKQPVFERAVKKARDLAEQGLLVTFGLNPKQPDTGFGYIEVGEPIDVADVSDSITAHKVKSFAEKPTMEIAEKYVASGDYLWNAGIFCFTAKAYLDALDVHAAEIYRGAEKCWQASSAQTSPLLMDKTLFATIPDISIDYAVMEKASNVAVVGCDMGWSDVGSWSALSELIPADAAGNRVEGEAVLVDSQDNYIRSEGRLVAAVGIKDLIVVDTSDALLVASRHHVQDVKKIVQKLKFEGHCSYRSHDTVHRPWGTYTELEQGNRFKIKRIVVKPGAALSLQMHYHRCEHWVVVSGTARIVNGDEEILLKTNESTFIPIGHKHRLENPGKTPLVLIEVQSGEYLQEDDIVRFDDVYGRIESGAK